MTVRPSPGPRDELYENWFASVLVRPRALAQLRGIFRARSPRDAVGLLAGRRGEDDRGKFVTIEAALELVDARLLLVPTPEHLPPDASGLLGPRDRHLTITGWFRTALRETPRLNADERRAQERSTDERDVAIVLGDDGSRLAVYQGRFGLPVARALWAFPSLAPEERARLQARSELEAELHGLLVRAHDLARDARAIEEKLPDSARGECRALALRARLASRRTPTALRELERRLADGP